jgi:hypothetical protein
MSADFSHIRKLLADRRISNQMKIGVPRPVLFALMGLVDQLLEDKKVLTAKVGMMEVQLDAGKDGRFGTDDDKVTIKRAAKKKPAAKKKAAAKKPAAKKKAATKK